MDDYDHAYVEGLFTGVIIAGLLCTCLIVVLFAKGVM